MHKHKILTTITAIVLVLVMAMGLVSCGAPGDSSTTDSTPAASTTPSAAPKEKNTAPIIITWYPNESASDYQGARDEFAKLVKQATGREVEHKLTTDYTIAIEALASGSADISFMGAAGYIEAKNKNDEVDVLFVNSGASGTLDDAIYYAWLAVNKGQESNYMKDGQYAIDKIQGQKISFVSNSSTSGFKVPTTQIIDFFSKNDAWKNLSVDDLLEGGSDKFFSEVLFGGSHQGSAFNLLSEKCDVAAFCDTELAPYADVTEGEENKVGSVYAIKPDASAPFDTVTGKEFVIISSTPVLNGPFAFNPKDLTTEEIQSIRDLFMTQEVANNPQMFVVKDSGYVGMFKKTGKEQFVLVEDSWYDPIREMGK